MTSTTAVAMKVAARRTALAAACAAGLAVSMATSAMAEGNGSTVSNVNKLKFESCATPGSGCEPGSGTTASWQTTSDSPLDTNRKALVVHVPVGDYSATYTLRSTRLSVPVGQVKNISYELSTDSPNGGGAPRISVIFANGDVAYLASSTCAQPLAVSGGGWLRADFTGAKTTNSASCSFPVTGTTAGTYANDATHSAFENYALLHPDQVVTLTFLVEDQPGDYKIDRLALGTNFLYNNSNTMAVNCGHNEAKC